MLEFSTPLDFIAYAEPVLARQKRYLPLTARCRHLITDSLILIGDGCGIKLNDLPYEIAQLAIAPKGGCYRAADWELRYVMHLFSLAFGHDHREVGSTMLLVAFLHATAMHRPVGTATALGDGFVQVDAHLVDTRVRIRVRVETADNIVPLPRGE